LSRANVQKSQGLEIYVGNSSMSEFGDCFPKATRQIGNLPNSNPLYRRSANVWLTRRLARFLTAMRSLTGNSDRGVEETSASFEARSAPRSYQLPLAELALTDEFISCCSGSPSPLDGPQRWPVGRPNFDSKLTKSSGRHQ